VRSAKSTADAESGAERSTEKIAEWVGRPNGPEGTHL
jgi:hypothetical protein